MLKEVFHDSFENFEITRICMENHASVTGWQKLFFSYKCFQLSAAVAIATFEIYGWKCSGFLILICSFSLCWQNFSKVNCFRVSSEFSFFFSRSFWTSLLFFCLVFQIFTYSGVHEIRLSSLDCCCGVAFVSVFAIHPLSIVRCVLKTCQVLLKGEQIYVCK